MPRGTFQCHHPCDKPIQTHVSIESPLTLAGSLVQSPVGSLLLSSGSWCMQTFVCAFQDWSVCFPQSSGRPIIKSHWPSRPNSLGIPSPFVLSPGWEAWHGVQNFHNSGTTSLVLLFSSLWVTQQMGMGFDFIVIEPFLSCCLAAASSLSLDIGYLFFVRFQCPAVDGCSTASCNFGALSGGDEHTSFYSTIFNWTLEGRLLTTGPRGKYCILSL